MISFLLTQGSDDLDKLLCHKEGLRGDFVERIGHCMNNGLQKIQRTDETIIYNMA